MRLTILGNNSAIPNNGRYPTAQILDQDGRLFLIDCGEGLQMNLKNYNIKRSRIHSIFISHLHGDHYFGLFGLLGSLSLQNHKDDIYLYGPATLMTIIQQIQEAAQSVFSFKLHFKAIADEESSVLFEDEKITISCFPVQHRIPTHGFKFAAKNGLRKINLEACEKYQVPVTFYKELQRGRDYLDEMGKLVPNKELTTEGKKGKTYVYTADTKYYPELAEQVGPCDLLYHESTYLEDNKIKAAERYHSTAAEAALTAKNAGAKQLLLGHFSSRYKDLEPFQVEAEAIFPNTKVSVQGKTYEL